jgi:cell division protease FtsH
MYFLFIFIFSTSIGIQCLNFRNIICKARNDIIMCSPFHDPNNLLYRKYPLSKNYYELQLKRLNSKNISLQLEEINKEETIKEDINIDDLEKEIINKKNPKFNRKRKIQPEFTIYLNKQLFDMPQDNNDDDDVYPKNTPHKMQNEFKKGKKSENFEVITSFPVTFKDIGGYEHIKEELMQCIDILKNYKMYEKYNVRTPKGLIFEGPPGNGKTLLAKGLAGEAKVNFISVSGSQFQEKYIGVGSSRIRELFQLASKNIPCIIFIDEIDAIGRTRSTDGESSSSERDNTLNELLVALDGFKNTNGVFIIGATNRLDLLDPALIRPGRIDKSIYIGVPNSIAREFIIKIHLKGKPYDETSFDVDDLVDLTKGLSCAQIENLLNEAMLHALRNKKTRMDYTDIDTIMNRLLAGWQSSNHEFTDSMIHHISVHEMGHVIVGLLCQYHSKVKKVAINLASPKSPAYTVFEGEDAAIYTKQSLFEHLMILLAGRIAEYEIFGSSFVSTGASNDFEEAIKLAEKMVMYYGMGKSTLYPQLSDTYKTMIDKDVFDLINDAYHNAEFIIRKSKKFIIDGASLLVEKKVLTLEELYKIYYKSQ